MAKKSNHRAVVFLQDYATKSAGDQFTCDGMLASSLVSRGIAEYKIEGKQEESKAEFKPLPEITKENSGEVKVSESKQSHHQNLRTRNEKNSFLIVSKRCNIVCNRSKLPGSA